jgi:molybdopterin synthase sulfur carrier subunit
MLGRMAHRVDGRASVRVLYFAGLRDAVGVAEESLELPAGVQTVGDLADHLAARHRAYAERRDHVRVARNEAFASADERLGDGDVIALIPPVAGG